MWAKPALPRRAVASLPSRKAAGRSRVTSFAAHYTDELTTRQSGQATRSKCSSGGKLKRGPIEGMKSNSRTFTLTTSSSVSRSVCAVHCAKVMPLFENNNHNNNKTLTRRLRRRMDDRHAKWKLRVWWSRGWKWWKPDSDGLMQGWANFLTCSYDLFQNLTVEPEQQQMDGEHCWLTHRRTTYEENSPKCIFYKHACILTGNTKFYCIPYSGGNELCLSDCWTLQC